MKRRKQRQAPVDRGSLRAAYEAAMRRFCGAWAGAILTAGDEVDHDRLFGDTAIAIGEAMELEEVTLSQARTAAGWLVEHGELGELGPALAEWFAAIDAKASELFAPGQPQPFVAVPFRVALLVVRGEMDLLSRRRH